MRAHSGQGALSELVGEGVLTVPLLTLSPVSSAVWSVICG